MSKTRTLADLDPTDQALVKAARDVSGNAYAPYSGFAVGAAVRTRSGRVYVGANLENAAYGVVMCGEVAALTAANTAGDFDIETIAVIGHKFRPPADASQVVTPCGRCRQMIAEAAQLAGRDVRVLACNGALSAITESSIAELLPSAFGPATLGLTETWPAMQKTLRAAVAKLRG